MDDKEPIEIFVRNIAIEMDPPASENMPPIPEIHPKIVLSPLWGYCIAFMIFRHLDDGLYHLTTQDYAYLLQRGGVLSCGGGDTEPVFIRDILEKEEPSFMSWLHHQATWVDR